MELKQDPEIIAQGIMLDLAMQISKKLEEEGLSQKDLAQRMGVSEGWISRFMNAPINWDNSTGLHCIPRHFRRPITAALSRRSI